MYDWGTHEVRVPADHLPEGFVIHLDPQGEIIKQWATWQPVEHGSGYGRMMVRPVTRDYLSGRAKAYRVSGNPTKFVQGHNVQGCTAARWWSVLREAMHSFPPEYAPREALPLLPLGVSSSRKDIALSFVMDDLQHVAAALSLLQSGRSREAKADWSGDKYPTVYFQKHSSRWTLKFYSKYHELLRNPPAIAEQSPQDYAALLEYSKPLLRGELTLRGQELRQYEIPHELGCGVDALYIDERAFYLYYSRLILSSGKPIAEGAAMLSSAYFKTFTRWQQGHNPRHFLKTRMTLYRHRKEIMAVTGRDIFAPYFSLPQADCKAFGITEAELREREAKLTDFPLQNRIHFPR